MTKEELKKATGQELIEQRDYCGVDGYYGDYLDDVNEEMLKRFNRLAELEKENAELKSEKGCEICTKFDEVNLTKARGLLRAWFKYCIDTKGKTPLKIETAQFLKEIEKC